MESTLEVRTYCLWLAYCWILEIGELGGDDSKGLLCNLILMLAKVSRGDYASCLGKGCRSGRKW